MTPEQAFALADPDGPLYLPGAFVLALGALRAEPRITEAFRTGAGMGWHEHDDDVVVGCELLFRPGYIANLVAAWLPGARRRRGQAARRRPGRRRRLRAGRLVRAAWRRRSRSVDGRRRRTTTTAPIDARPQAGGRGRGRRPGRRSRWRGAQTFSGTGYDLVATFDCLHDMGDPLGAARHVREALRRRRHLDDRRAARRATRSRTTSTRSAGRTTGSRRCCACPTLAVPAGRATRSARRPARPAIRQVVTDAGLHPVPAGGRRPRSTTSTRSATVERPAGGDAMRARESGRPSALDRAGRRAGRRTRCSSYGAGRPRSCCCPPGRSCTRGSGRRRCPTWPGTSGWSPSTGRGNGAVGPAAGPRPPTPTSEYVDDAVAVLDAAGVDRAVLVGLSMRRPARAAARRRGTRSGCRRRGDRRRRGSPWPPPARGLRRRAADARTRAGRRTTGTTGSRDYRGFVEFFFVADVPEPHSTKQIEDGVGWGLETDARDARSHRPRPDRAPTTRDAGRGAAAPVRCPVLVIHGERRPDRPVRDRRAAGRADRRDARHASTAPGTGRRPATRCGQPADPRVRRAGRGPPPAGAAAWTPAPQPAAARALYLSSPIGLGHARRDLAIADELRALHPDLRDRLAGPGPGDPAARRPRRARAPGVSRFLASEAAHIEREAGEHDLHAFQAIRRMDEILVANFMVFHEVVARTSSTTWWSATRPGRSTTSCTRTPSSSARAYAWLTDFVGWLPMPDGGAARGGADGRLQRRDGRARRPLPAAARPVDVRRRPRRRRARPVRPGPADGPRLDRARTSTSPATSPGSTRRRPRPDGCGAELGYRPDERVCVVTVGGSGVGGAAAAAGRRRRYP